MPGRSRTRSFSLSLCFSRFFSRSRSCSRSLSRLLSPGRRSILLRDRERERSPPFPALYRAGLAPRSSRAALVTSKWVADCESLPHRAQKRPVRAPPHVTQKIIEVSAQPRQCAAAARRRLVRLSAVRRLRSCSATVSPPPATAAGHRRLRCCCCLGPTRRPVLPTGGRSFGGRGVVCQVWCAAGPAVGIFFAAGANSGVSLVYPH